MGVVKQLYQLQEIDLELETNGQAIGGVISQIGESEAVLAVQKKLSLENEHLEELKKKQRSMEWEVDDITNKVTVSEKELYSGRITSPKELTSLQNEIKGLKAKRSQIEDEILALMEQVELATQNAAKQSNELEALKAGWQSQQQRLSAELKQLKATKANLEKERQILAAEIEPQALAIYNELKKKRVTALAKVEQGMCRSCRISLPLSELQLARSGSLVRCGSCGRILFLA